MQSPCNPLTENYAEIFYMIDEQDSPSIQCKMSLRRPKSIRRVDGLELIFIDFYVPVGVKVSVTLRLAVYRK
jgi:hypothetical protein